MTILLVAIFVAVSVWPAWRVMQAFRTGVIQGRNFPYARSAQPTWFWAYVAGYTFVAVVCWLAAIGSAI